MAIVEVTRPVVGGVDTHLDVHVAAAVDPIGGLLGVESFPTTVAG
ncbi:MAG TPA: IS110 family transposase, partial [Jiangellaceae bacterium]|nr:IS110 family transposase [Jiangellaceae bacterium]